MIKEGNNGYFFIFIVAISVIVSSSFANNFFTYFFMTKFEFHERYTNNTNMITPQPFQPEIDNSWKWNYSEIGIKQNNYPIVVLRDGYKAIKLSGENVLVGWKYELLNTSPVDEYKVSITYKFNDEDNFEIIESSASDTVRPGQIGTIQTTTLVPYEDFIRVSGVSWFVNLYPNWVDKNLEGNRFERAGIILKKNAPSWFIKRMQYLFLSGEFLKIFYPNKWIISEAMGIIPDTKLEDVSKKLNINFKERNLPDWNTISSNQNYLTLTKEEKESLKTFLSAQKEYGNYSPTTGRTDTNNFIWGWEEDFPEP